MKIPKALFPFFIFIAILSILVIFVVKWENLLGKETGAKSNSNNVIDDLELGNSPSSEVINMNDIGNIHKNLTVCDTHCDTIDRILKGINLGIRTDQGHIDIPRMQEGGVDIQVFACCIGRPKKEYPESYAKLTTKMINALKSEFQKHPDKIAIALTPDDIKNSIDSGKISAILAIEGGRAIENNLDKLREFYDSGVRLMTLVWNSNDWADSSQEKPKHNGLTNFGKEVVREMNRLGMIVDVSHASDKTVLDTLEVSNAPIIASHSCVKAICDHPRNLNDDLIKAIAKSEGVICVNFYSVFLDQEFKDKKNLYSKNKASSEENSISSRQKPPSISKVIDHIDHLVKVGGIDCVGLGSDYDGMNPPPEGLEDISKMPRITEELLKKGYSLDEVGKIMGGNFLRVFNRVCGKKDIPIL